MRLLIILLTFIGLSACYEDPIFRVEVCGDVRIPRDVDAYRISIWDADLSTELASGTRELVSCPGVQTRSLPQTDNLPAFAGDTWVRVQGLKDGLTVTRYDRRVRVDDDEDADILVSITQSCLGVMCARGQTCLAGECVLAEFNSGSEICSGPASTDESPDPVEYCPDDSDEEGI